MQKTNPLFAFVILHYNAMKETLDCISSIKKHVHKVAYHIVVVDNASPNKTGNVLEDLFLTDSVVTILRCDENLGFAKGNNKGIYYAKEKLDADFLIVLNNDTILEQDDFVQIIEQEWEKSHFAVLGPHVDTLTGVNQNPVPYAITTRKDIARAKYFYYTELIRSYLGVEKMWKDFKNFIKKCIAKDLQNSTADTRQEMVKLHGCCWVFSPAYFKVFRGLDDRTFMYLEEDILWNHILQAGLLSVYNPELKIFHAEDAATNSVHKTWRKKRIFFLEQHLKSLKVLESILQRK